ncbi:MAG: septum formation protein Maf [Bdellovibrionales bacterium]|nr:septum formation protein Maf [Bdellovibrionales bacterium]
MTRRVDPPLLILASTSGYRKRQLESWEIPFTAMAPQIDEETLKIQLSSLSPQNLCLALAKAKAKSLADTRPNAIVIGSDQIALFEGQILSKPGSPEKAKAQLGLLEGKTHSLLTALHVIYNQKEISLVEEVQVTLKNLSSQEIDFYLSWERPFDCAGSYKFEKMGICMIESLKGRDPSSIIGLPLMGLSECIEKLTGEKPFCLYPPPSQSSEVFFSQSSSPKGGRLA